MISLILICNVALADMDPCDNLTNHHFVSEKNFEEAPPTGPSFAGLGRSISFGKEEFTFIDGDAISPGSYSCDNGTIKLVFFHKTAEAQYDVKAGVVQLDGEKYFLEQPADEEDGKEK